MLETKWRLRIYIYIYIHEGIYAVIGNRVFHIPRVRIRFDFSKNGSTIARRFYKFWIVERKEERGKELKLELKSSYPATFSKHGTSERFSRSGRERWRGEEEKDKEGEKSGSFHS